MTTIRFNILWSIVSSFFLFSSLQLIGDEKTLFKAPCGNFSYDAYKQAVESYFAFYESQSPKGAIGPGKHGKAGIKIFTRFGPGLCTPPTLVRAVIDCLKKRGFKDDTLFIVDEQARKLCACGFLPPLSAEQEPKTFCSVPVYALDSQKYWKPEWVYEAPIGSSFYDSQENQDPKKSFLAAPLFLEVDFWINLPVLVSLPNLQTCGALANATLFNISNNKRFLQNGAHASVAISEIASIPEMRATWAFSLVSLEHYQYISAYNFYAGFTESAPWLIGCQDPLTLDRFLYGLLNVTRKAHGLQAFEEPDLYFGFYESLQKDK